MLGYNWHSVHVGRIFRQQHLWNRAATQDADFVIQTATGQLSAFRDALGAEFQFESQLQFETVTGTQKYLVRHRKSKFVIELFLLSTEPHDQQRFSRRKKLSVLGMDAWVLTAEDVLVTKLNWLKIVNRPKDRSDVINVIAVQGDAIDWPYVEHWCDEHGSRLILEQIREDLRNSLGN